MGALVLHPRGLEELHARIVAETIVDTLLAAARVSRGLYSRRIEMEGVRRASSPTVRRIQPSPASRSAAFENGATVEHFGISFSR
jgi:hypothetical protein